MATPRKQRRHQEVLDPAVAAVDRPDSQRASHPLSGRSVDALVGNVECPGNRRITAVGVGDRQGIGRHYRRPYRLRVAGVERRQAVAHGWSTPVGCPQDGRLPLGQQYREHRVFRRSGLGMGSGQGRVQWKPRQPQGWPTGSMQWLQGQWKGCKGFPMGSCQQAIKPVPDNKRNEP